MTQSEEIIEIWWIWWITSYKDNLLDYTNEKQMKEYFKGKIEHIAERGKEEALRSFNLIAPGKDVPVGMIRDAIRSRRWWEKEVKK